MKEECFEQFGITSSCCWLCAFSILCEMSQFDEFTSTVRTVRTGACLAGMSLWRGKSGAVCVMLHNPNRLQ